jgi:hypothetical protein
MSNPTSFRQLFAGRYPWFPNLSGGMEEELRHGIIAPGEQDAGRITMLPALAVPGTISLCTCRPFQNVM